MRVSTVCPGKEGSSLDPPVPRGTEEVEFPTGGHCFVLMDTGSNGRRQSFSD